MCLGGHVHDAMRLDHMSTQCVAAGIDVHLLVQFARLERLRAQLVTFRHRRNVKQNRRWARLGVALLSNVGEM
eukprot:7763658-Alexandrium_andersonii.AAC.1